MSLIAARNFPRRVLGAVLAVSLSGLALGVVPGSTALRAAGLSATTAAQAPATLSSRTLSPSAAACTNRAKAPGGSRVLPGSQVADPDTLSVSQVRAVEAKTATRATVRGLTKNADGQLTRSTRTPTVSPSSRSSATGSSPARASAQKAFTPPVIGVYWHVITDGRSGKLSSTTIGQQISVLNAAYQAAGLSFKLTRTDTTTSSDWFNTTGPTGSGANGDASDARAMKTKLHVGTRSTLNIYSVRFSDDTLGYSTFPFSGTLALDGDVFDYRTLPGGSLSGYNLGDTATHEIGHWFGLYHTFQGGCSATAGDYVSDTPAEAYPAWDCTAKDSCPSLPGTDPIKNFMDYAPDACMNTFTAGQRTRMQNEWLTYRAAKV